MKISVVIPVRNGASTLDSCLSAICNQELPIPPEIIVLDSASGDNSVAIAAKYGAIVHAVEPGTFNHGLTRNMGAALCTGELIFFTVQDATLVDAGMLAKMSAHFADHQVAGVYGHQAVAHNPDMNPVQWHRRYSKPKVEVRHFEPVVFKQLSKKEQFKNATWDNVVAMYRRTDLQEIPFVETSFAEDYMWAHHALLKGKKIVYDPSVLVWHYHYRNFRYAFHVAYTLNYTFYQYFKILPPLPGLILPILRAGYSLYKNTGLKFSQKIKWFAHNISSIAGHFLSHLTFLISYYTGGEKGLKSSYKVFCNEVPQGKLKSTV